MIVKLKGTVLEEHLLRNNVSRSAFAHSATLSGGYLAQLLSGKRSPSGRVRARLMTASGISFDDLFQIVSDDTHTLEEATVC